MIQYRIIECALGQLEEKLNGMANKRWVLNQISVLDKENIVAVLEKPSGSDEELQQNVSQQLEWAFQTAASISKSKHDLFKLMLQNLRP